MKIFQMDSKLPCLMVKNMHDSHWTVSSSLCPYFRGLPLKDTGSIARLEGHLISGVSTQATDE